MLDDIEARTYQEMNHNMNYESLKNLKKSKAYVVN